QGARLRPGRVKTFPELHEVVPWGRSRAEYVRMFDLTPDDLSGRIVDCAAGPASFNAELSAEGRDVTSCDPLYTLTAHKIRSRIGVTYDTVVANARAARDEFQWDGDEMLAVGKPGPTREE
ncbi:MAG: hypothetical protein H0U55_08910, partial [Rubrobacteraceae bacterium]|nr:hypothetical protein [Rubrobacteraceae bacterium]